MIRRWRKWLALWLCDIKYPEPCAARTKLRRAIAQRYRKPRVKPVPDVGTPKGLSE